MLSSITFYFVQCCLKPLCDFQLSVFACWVKFLKTIMEVGGSGDLHHKEALVQRYSLIPGMFVNRTHIAAPRVGFFPLLGVTIWYISLWVRMPFHAWIFHYFHYSLVFCSISWSTLVVNISCIVCISFFSVAVATWRVSPGSIGTCLVAGGIVIFCWLFLLL